MLSADSRANDAAAIIRAYQWAGYYPGKRIFSVRGIPEVSWEFKYNLLGTSLNFNSIKLTRKSAIRVLEEIKKLRPKVYSGYPFSLIMLSKIANDEKIEIPPGRYIIVTGETTTENNRKALKDAYGGKVFDVYGMTENAVMITECEYGNKHVIDDFAYHEFVDDKGTILETEGRAEIVGTSYSNYAMPLIRYKTRDNATLKPHGEVCQCKRNFRMVQEIEGRKDDFIKTPEGKLLRMIHLAITRGKGIAGSQYVQDALDHMYVNIVPGPDFEKDSLKEVEKHLHMRLGNSIRIDFKIVSELEKTRLGKTPFIISKIGLSL
jgi:phenylacetate-CoA ligase